jgi:hypothetical protein
MRRIAVPLSVVAVVLLGLFAAGRPNLGTVAQDDATAAHPVVGAWLLTDPAFPEEAPTLVQFHADGTYVQAEAEGGVGVGAWEATGERSVAVTFVEQFGGEEGVFTITIRAAGEVAADGQSFTATYTIELTLPDGTSAGEYGPGTVEATRIAVEPMGTPVGPLEDLFAQFEEAEGTPAAAAPAAVRIVSPAAGESVAGPDVAVAWEAPGLSIAPAAEATGPEDYHAHFIVDGAYAVVEGQPIPQQDGVVHTAANPATLPGLAPGEHTVQLVLGDPGHVPVPGLERPSVTFTVA